MKISRFVCFTFLLLSFSCSAQINDINNAKWTSEIDSIVNSHSFNGVVYLSSGDKDIYYKTFGFSDLEKETIFEVDDQFVIGSISKQITVVLLLREFEKGKIGLDDTLGEYLHELKQPWANKVTIHHLLTHTHGIVDIEEPLVFEQGTQFSYSQLGYQLLAQILEKVTGETFEELATSLFEYYGLRHTFHPNSKGIQRLVKGYEQSDAGALMYAENSLSNYAPAGSFISNAKDLKQWNELLHSGKLVRKETLELMKVKYATRIHPIFDTIEYGYGLLFKDGEQNIQIGALGYAPGFASASFYYPSTKLNLIILENTAYHLDNFKETFAVHTAIMELIKNGRKE